MAEDTRLKHSKEMLYIKNQSNNQSNQPQHPQQTIHTEKLLKETDDCNNIDYTIMDTSQQIVLEYLLSSEKGEILKRNGEELKKLKIGDKTYNFERGKPISKRSITKFNKIKQTMDYKKYELTFFSQPFHVFDMCWQCPAIPQLFVDVELGQSACDCLNSLAVNCLAQEDQEASIVYR